MVVKLSGSLYAEGRYPAVAAVARPDSDCLMHDAASSNSSWEGLAYAPACDSADLLDQKGVEDLLNHDIANPEDARVLPELARVLEAVVAGHERQEHELQGAAAATCGSRRVTVFHGLRAPPISIEAYMIRIAKYAKCSPVCFVQAMVFIKRLAQKDVGLRPMSLNVHRLVLTGVLLAAKLLDDRYYNNAFYAKVGGISTAELNRLEMAMLKLLDFQLGASMAEITQLLNDVRSGPSTFLADTSSVITTAAATAVVGRHKRRSCSSGPELDGDCRRSMRRSIDAHCEVFV